MLTQKAIERLSKLGSKDFFITSLYLNVDRNAKNNDYKIVLKDLLKEKRQRLESVKVERKLTREQTQSIENDFTKLEQFINSGYIHKDNHKGLVIFCSAGNNFWEMFELPQPVADYLNVDIDPYVRPLSELVCDHRSYAILLVDSAKAKMFGVHLGFVKEQFHIQNTVQPKIKYGGIDGMDERKVDRAHDEMVAKHFKHVAGEAEKLLAAGDMVWLIMGGRQNMINQFESLLSGQTRKKIIGHIVVEPEAPLTDVLYKAEEVAKQAEKKYETELIEKLRAEAHGTGGKGIFGLQPTLQSLRRGGVNTLVIAKGYTAPGFVCHKCFFIGVPEEKGAKNTCPICSGDAHDVHDVIDEAITFAFMQGCRVENTAENSRLKIMGNIGAILRY